MMVISDIDFERVSKIGGDGDRERFGNSVGVGFPSHFTGRVSTSFRYHLNVESGSQDACGAE